MFNIGMTKLLHVVKIVMTCGSPLNVSRVATETVGVHKHQCRMSDLSSYCVRMSDLKRCTTVYASMYGCLIQASHRAGKAC